MMNNKKTVVAFESISNMFLKPNVRHILYFGPALHWLLIKALVKRDREKMNCSANRNSKHKHGIT